MLVDCNVLVNQMASLMWGTVYLNKIIAFLSSKCLSVNITSQQNSQLCTPPLRQLHEPPLGKASHTAAQHTQVVTESNIALVLQHRCIGHVRRVPCTTYAPEHRQT